MKNSVSFAFTENIKEINPPNGSMVRHGGVEKYESRVPHASLTLGAVRQISSFESASSRVVTHRHALSA